MSVFISPEEALAVGVPLIRLYRAAIGRDPSPSGLSSLAAAWRNGLRLPEIAASLLATPEGRAVSGDEPPEASASAPFIAQAASRAALRLTSHTDPPVGVAPGRTSRSDALAAIAAVAAPHEPPMLPALFCDSSPDDPVAYGFWTRFAEPALLPTAASDLLVSVVMAAGDSGAEGVVKTFDSLRAQSHVAWELILVARFRSEWAREAVNRAAADPRVRVIMIDEPPAGALAEAVMSAAGGLICMLEPGDRLAPEALALSAEAFDVDPDLMMLYTDEDCAGPGGERSMPCFKPGFSGDAMLAGDMTGQLTVLRAELVRRLGGLRSVAAPHEHYDLALRVAQAAGAAAVRHLPAILCHRAEASADWRISASALTRQGSDLSVADGEPWPRVFALAPRQWPLVSVVMATRDRGGLLRKATRGLLHETDYPAIELLLVDHETREPEAVDLLDRLSHDARVRILKWSGPFNFAAMNNRAAAGARGEVLLLMNNDVEVREAGWLREMVAHAIRPSVGAVGARLLDADGMLQHGGIVLAPGGRAVHVMRGAAPMDAGYLGQLACVRDLAAVTGACMAIRREVWRQVGGMDETFPVAWNDIDLCQRLRAAGLRIVWTPHATLIHLEGETRGRDADDPARLAAFEADRARYRAIWSTAADQDPFLNPNLTPADDGLRLAVPRS